MKKYRTQAQLEEIAEGCNNGNWTWAAEKCEEGGFWVSDIVNFDVEELFDEGWKDVAHLVEQAQNIRGIKALKEFENEK